MRNFILGFLFHVLLVNLVWFDAQYSWQSVIKTKLPDRWQVWDEERICSDQCEKIVRMEFVKSITDFVRWLYREEEQ